MLFDEHGNPWPRFVPKPRPACATLHHMPASWQSGGFDKRGMELIVCRHCLRPIGYRNSTVEKKGATLENASRD
jgi:hypothetical protein